MLPNHIKSQARRYQNPLYQNKYWVQGTLCYCYQDKSLYMYFDTISLCIENYYVTTSYLQLLQMQIIRKVFGLLVLIDIRFIGCVFLWLSEIKCDKALQGIRPICILILSASEGDRTQLALKPPCHCFLCPISPYQGYNHYDNVYSWQDISSLNKFPKQQNFK